MTREPTRADKRATGRLIQRAELALVYKPVIEKVAKANQGVRYDLSDISQSSARSKETRVELANIAGVGRSTIAQAEKVKEWKAVTLKRSTLTNEIARDLYEAREQLSRSGYRSDLVTNVTRLPTWQGYLKEVGLERMTVHRWLDYYEPTEQRLLTNSTRLHTCHQRPIDGLQSIFIE